MIATITDTASRTEEQLAREEQTIKERLNTILQYIPDFPPEPLYNLSCLRTKGEETHPLYDDSPEVLPSQEFFRMFGLFAGTPFPLKRQLPGSLTGEYRTFGVTSRGEWVIITIDFDLIPETGYERARVVHVQQGNPRGVLALGMDAWHIVHFLQFNTERWAQRLKQRSDTAQQIFREMELLNRMLRNGP